MAETTKSKKPKISSSLLSFSKAQVSAFIGGVVDYVVMIFVTEHFHVHYTISIAISGIVGAIVNFSVNRKWSFYSKEAVYKYNAMQQLMMFSLRYLVVSP